MPRTIETAPRNENVVLVEDRTFGTYDVAHWSPEAGGWVGENGEPIKYTPSHWYPMPGENYLQQADGLSSGLSEASLSASRARRHRFFPFFLIATALGWVMSRIEYLKEQTAKAERLARSVVDAVTVERLMAFAAECRAEVNARTEQR
jgi:hypothetical protein